MLKRFSGEGQLSGGHSSSSPAGRGLSSAGLDAQESSWLGLLSRPAMAFLQRYLPGRPQTLIRGETGAGWISGGLKYSFVDEETEFLRQLDDMMPLTQHPAPYLTHSRHQPGRAPGRMEPWGGSTLTWLTADSLLEMGIQTSEEIDLNFYPQTQTRHLSAVRTFFRHDPLSLVSSQEMGPRGPKDWDPAGHPGKSRTWWGSFWEDGENMRKGLLSDAPTAGEVSVTGCLCTQQPVVETKVNETTGLFVQCGGRGWTPRENTGLADLKEELPHNTGLPTVQNTEGSATDRQRKISNHLGNSGAAAACSEVALLTPDRDNGYSSLEEEHFQMGHLAIKVQSEALPQQEVDSVENGTAVETEMEVGTSEEGGAKSGIEEGEEKEESVEGIAHTHPQCQNKAVAFIMGCPCSDDSSQSDGTSSGEEDEDAGFRSEGSSDESESDSSDDDDDDDEEDDEDSDCEADTEAERMWSSLCKSVDPYNPLNFTAQQHTVTSPPRPIPTSTPSSSALSTPASSPELTLRPPSNLVASPPSGSDTWDDSTSASEVDEAESLRLFSSFGCSSDPYSPLNFQATFRSSGPVEGAGLSARPNKASQTPSCSLRLKTASPPEYRKEEAEERLDSGFSEPSTSSGCSTTQSCSTTKKVRFCDDVEEFFASCGEGEEEEEDRRGPWEELARDRCRFLRRCQEVEQSIDYCLQPQHRTLVYCRLVTVLYAQDA
ncbi:uncharacterized protein ppp1r15b [Spinachia spinachia]